MDLTTYTHAHQLTDSQRKALKRAENILFKLYKTSRVTDEPVRSPEVLRNMLKLRFAGAEREIFTVIFLDNRHRAIAIEDVFVGTIDSSIVCPRDVLKRALHHNAAALACAHNHPSGVAEPSDTDVRLTRKLVDTMSLCDIRILDHLIIGGTQSTSLAERGLM